MTTTPQAHPSWPAEGQAPYGYPPAAPPAPPKKPLYKKKRFIIPVGLVVLSVFGSALGGGENEPTSTSGAEATGGAAEAPAEVVDSAPAAVGLGQPAADGKFSFVVNGVDCSQTQIGNQFLNTTAQGKFCVVDMSISNIGNEPQSFFGDNAKLFNAEGQQFSADGEAAIYLENSESLYEEINPGNSLTTKVVFDVPADMTPTSIELHDSAFSGGVTVALQ